MKSIVIVRDQYGKEEELWGNTIEVVEGVLNVYYEEMAATTTTVVFPRFLSGPKTTTETTITKKKYVSASYPSGCWSAAYAKVSKVDKAENQV